MDTPVLEDYEVMPACRRCVEAATTTWRRMKVHLKNLADAHAHLEAAKLKDVNESMILYEMEVKRLTMLVEKTWNANEEVFKNMAECSRENTLARIMDAN